MFATGDNEAASSTSPAVGSDGLTSRQELAAPIGGSALRRRLLTRGGALEHHDVAEDAIPLDEAKRVLRLGCVPDRLDEVLIGPANGRAVPKGEA